jgi:(1->4)-alpha-D-glucan 1-alpha-D-glucosylmutase
LSAPRATYRVQLRPGFGFAEAAELADYLEELGVSHLYTSPYLQAAHGSQHGYDVTDHRRVNTELGGAEGHRALSKALAARGIGQLVDLVPNHMAIGTADNAWWWDVLENGPSSRYATYFDVDWHPGEDADNRILLPILGERYADAISSGVLKVTREGARFFVTYRETRLPVAPRSLSEPLGRAAAQARSPELAFFADALGSLPKPGATDQTSMARRHRDREVIEGLLGKLFASDEERRGEGEAPIRSSRAESRDPSPDESQSGPRTPLRPLTPASAVDAELAALSADAGRLDTFLEHQNWRLGFWRYALGELGYRRFFDVANLAGLRVEEPWVFEDVHELVLGWLEDGTIDGLRIDHVDGLRDPAAYLEQLRRRAPHAWIVVEKILAPGEPLPETWPIDGTTGYEFTRLMDGVFVDPSGEGALDRLWLEFGGNPAPLAAQARQARLDVIGGLLSSERDRLVALALRLVAGEPTLRDVTARELRHAITELLASYPVYRTYARPGRVTSELDRAHAATAFAAAAAAQPEVDHRVWEVLQRALLLEAPPTAQGVDVELALRFQQTSGAVMAKGLEDTLFYRNARLLALNEVGSAIDRFGASLDEFHAAMAAASPRTLLATSTHDTKRGEEVRARLLVLSELPDAWAKAVSRWSERAAPYRAFTLPDRPTEYFIWQTLVGAWPLTKDRARAYFEKAFREAKVHTSWLTPDATYESAVARFVESVLDDRTLRGELDAFVASLEPAAQRIALGRTLIKLTAPGVPDLYQGTELWETSLVDPDNRRPVDFVARRELLHRARDASPERALIASDTGLPKLWLIRRVLHARRRHPKLFEGAYSRVAVEGEAAERVIAFSRGSELITLVPRWTAKTVAWDETQITLPPGRWVDVLTRERLEGGRPLIMEKAWARFPVALLALQRADEEDP